MATKTGKAPSPQEGTSQDGERVPTYEEATTGQSAAAAPSVAPPPPPSQQQKHTSSVYPFPSLGTERDEYGQSPYQRDGTLRVAIARPGEVAGAAGGSNAPLLPVPVSSLQQPHPARRGPRAGRRFCAALFWAVVLYCLLTLATSALVEYIDDNNGPRKHPPTGGPPGWHHHHGSGDGDGDADGRGGLKSPRFGTSLLPRIE